MVDWWSLGVLAYEMMAGVAPFTDKKRDIHNIERKIKENRPIYPSYFTPLAKSFIQALLQNYPDKRLGYKGANEVKAHPFFQDIDWQDVYNRKLTPPVRNCKKLVLDPNSPPIDDSVSSDGLNKIEGITYNCEKKLP